MERSDTTALSSYVLVNDTLLVNESSPTEENGALYQSSAGNTYSRSPFSGGRRGFSHYSDINSIVKVYQSVRSLFALETNKMEYQHAYVLSPPTAR